MSSRSSSASRRRASLDASAEGLFTRRGMGSNTPGKPLGATSSSPMSSGSSPEPTGGSGRGVASGCVGMVDTGSAYFRARGCGKGRSLRSTFVVAVALIGELAQRDAEVEGALGPRDPDGGDLVDAGDAREPAKLVRAFDRLSVEGDDHVVGGDARALGRAAREHARHPCALAV